MSTRLALLLNFLCYPSKKSIAEFVITYNSPRWGTMSNKEGPGMKCDVYTEGQFVCPVSPHPMAQEMYAAYKICFELSGSSSLEYNTAVYCTV